MKKFLVLSLLAVFMASPALVHAGANEKALENASDQAVFNRVGDWFATVGKSDAEKAQIKAERRSKRAAKKAEKEARKAKKKAMEKKDEMKQKMKGFKDSDRKGS